MTGKLTSPSEENYLEWIYRFSRQQPVRPSKLADKLGLKRPSITKAVDSLEKSGFVHRTAKGALELTEQGEALGRAVVRRDQCLTMLLVEVLGMAPETTDPEVHRMEHALSDEVLIRLEVLVDFARSSPAWLKRLRLRIDEKLRSAPSDGRFAVGQTPMHSGFPHEKNSVRVDSD